MELRMMMVVMMMMVRAEGVNVMKVRAELGTDVSLNCSIRNRDIYWFVEIYGQIRAGIGRLYHPDSYQYYSLDSESKYFMVETRLEIKNVNVDDCRSYFCAEKNYGNLVFVDSFLLEPDVWTPPLTNTSVCDVQCCRGQAAVIYHGVLVGVLVLSLVAGLLVSSVKKVSRHLEGAAASTASSPQMLQTEAAAYRGRRREPSTSI